MRTSLNEQEEQTISQKHISTPHFVAEKCRKIKLHILDFPLFETAKSLINRHIGKIKSQVNHNPKLLHQIYPPYQKQKRKEHTRKHEPSSCWENWGGK